MPRGFDPGNVDRSVAGSASEAESVTDDRIRRSGARPISRAPESHAIPTERLVERGADDRLGRQGLDFTDDLRGEEMGLAVGLEAGETGIRQLV